MINNHRPDVKQTTELQIHHHANEWLDNDSFQTLTNGVAAATRPPSMHKYTQHIRHSNCSQTVKY